METMYHTTFQPTFKDDDDWSSSPSALSQSCWPESDLMVHSGSPFQLPMQQHMFANVEVQQFMQPYGAVFTPGSTPLLNADASPFLPTLYPVKPEQVIPERPLLCNLQVNLQQMPFPTPDPSPHLTPSPRIRPVPDQSGSINALMKEIQSKTKELGSPCSEPEHFHSTQTRDVPSTPSSGKKDHSPKEKKHVCPHSDCGKLFSQKTHLDIHLRSHSGLKPFSCPYPPCPSRFTQLGNLKTHVRRHTGEKPFACALCPKRFAQRGNVRSHIATVHASREEKRMFECRLEGCGKFFSQRGNLKGHMERFHADAINELTLKFSGISQPDDVVRTLTADERELWDYLKDMYKYSNMGIKGRGKDRKVMTINNSTTPTSTTSKVTLVQPSDDYRSMSKSFASNFSMSKP